jgi:hypothetical protein
VNTLLSLIWLVVIAASNCCQTLLSVIMHVSHSRECRKQIGFVTPKALSGVRVPYSAAVAMEGGSTGSARRQSLAAECAGMGDGRFGPLQRVGSGHWYRHKAKINAIDICILPLYCFKKVILVTKVYRG